MESFAEILKEKIEKSKNHESKFHFSSDNSANSSPAGVTENALDLSLFQTKWFQQNPNKFQNSSNNTFNQTAYKHFKTQPQRQENSHRSQFQANTPKTNQKVSENIAPKSSSRPRTVAHKLNETQTRSMTYFISEKMFLLDDFTTDELKRAYKRLALKKHPDRSTGSNQLFTELQTHYKILSAVPSR